MELLKLAPGSKNWAKEAPHLGVLVADYRFFENAYDHGLALIDTSLFAAYLGLAMTAHGLGSCLMNWPDISTHHAIAKEVLGIDCQQTVVMLMAFGFPDPDGIIASSTKKSVCEVIQYVN